MPVGKSHSLHMSLPMRRRHLNRKMTERWNKQSSMQLAQKQHTGPIKVRLIPKAVSKHEYHTGTMKSCYVSCVSDPPPQKLKIFLLEQGSASGAPKTSQPLPSLPSRPPFCETQRKWNQDYQRLILGDRVSDRRCLESPQIMGMIKMRMAVMSRMFLVTWG